MSKDNTLLNFALILMGFGVLGIYGGGSRLFLYWQSSDWQKTPATIVHVKFNVHGGDKTTYSVSCVYRYRFDGGEYQGEQVGIEQYDSADGFHRRRYRILKRHMDSGSPFSALVNPSDPRESLLFRRFHGGELAFICVGGVFLLAGLEFLRRWIRNRRIMRRTAQRARLHWTDRLRSPKPVPDAFSIRDRSLGRVGRVLGFGMALLLFSLSFPMIGGSDMPAFAIIILGIFLLISLYLLMYGGYQGLCYLVFGASTLDISQLPLVQGMAFSGLIRLKRGFKSLGPLEITLKCVREYTWDSDFSEKGEESLYEKRLIVPPDPLCPGRWRFGFQVPEGYPDAGFIRDQRYGWVLEASGKKGEMDYFAAFELPVHAAHPSQVRFNPRFDGT